MPDTIYFDKVLLIDGSYAEVCDSVARAAIQGGTYFLGVTTTELSDGAATNPIYINNEEITAKNGDMVIYGNKEFVYAEIDSAWHELGDIDLAKIHLVGTVTDGILEFSFGFNNANQ